MRLRRVVEAALSLTVAFHPARGVFCLCPEVPPSALGRCPSASQAAVPPCRSRLVVLGFL